MIKNFRCQLKMCKGAHAFSQVGHKQKFEDHLYFIFMLTVSKAVSKSANWRVKVAV